MVSRASDPEDYERDAGAASLFLSGPSYSDCSHCLRRVLRCGARGLFYYIFLFLDPRARRLHTPYTATGCNYQSHYSA
jgi:hypothetical protein